jgi:hypothetical protein
MTPETKKSSKVEAEYQHYPHQHRRCSQCSYFQAPDGCEKVEGEISKHGYCKWFEASRSTRWYQKETK